MEQQDIAASAAGVSKSVAVIACTAMAVFYVAVLYFPTLILRLPPPSSFKSFLIRRFICAAVSSIVSLVACSLILPIRRWDASHLFGVYGIRLDHIWQALVFPLSLTSLMYTGSFVLKFLLALSTCSEHWNNSGILSVVFIKGVLQRFICWILSMASNISSWRNYFVAPLTEELVFRSCMIPLLLCGGFSTYTVIFLCPVFFSLAHLNHLLEFYLQKHCSFLKACTAVGFQLGYTVIFGWYASFLFVRTGHLVSPLAAHIFCNFMGLPVIFSRRSGLLVSLAFIAGVMGFFWLLFRLTTPQLFNSATDNCECWHRSTPYPPTQPPSPLSYATYVKKLTRVKDDKIFCSMSRPSSLPSITWVDWTTYDDDVHSFLVDLEAFEFKEEFGP
ncbi:CAAX prenyl protease 2 [Forsythia ovata]|uniref:intramembrane prenyl-peptidase Rce1 n=1 Tax=Forsythia ovata TaxID=205694 RepID=A0ABD1T7Y7_9LAMI